MNFFKNKKGFTLVELVVVIAILGILAGIAIPRFMDATASARGAKIIADMRTLESAESMHYAQKGTYAADVAALKTAGLLAAEPTPPTGTFIIPESNNTGTGASKYTITVTPATATAIATCKIELTATTGGGELDALLKKASKSS